jgi:hypothetical protein
VFMNVICTVYRRIRSDSKGIERIADRMSFIKLLVSGMML